MSILDPILAPVKAKAKLIGFVVAGGALVALGLLAWYFWTDYKKVQDELATTTQKLSLREQENKNLVSTIEKSKSSTKINDDTQAAVDTGTKVIDKNTTSIAETHVKNVQKIEAKYESLPKTDANVKAKEDEISTDRVKRLWEVYCIANPEHARCQPQAAASAASQ